MAAATAAAAAATAGASASRKNDMHKAGAPYTPTYGCEN